MKKKMTIMFVLISAFVWQIKAQTPPPPINGVSCSPGTPSSYLYTEDFEYIDTNDATANGGWTGKLDQNNNNPTWPKNGQWGICAESELRTGNTGPSSAYSGSKYLMFEGNGGNNTAEAVSPAIDLTFTSEDLELSFYMHAWGADIGALNVGVGTSPTGPFTNVFTQTGAYQNDWAPVGVNLSTYLGQVIYLSFDYTAGTANFADIAIDFIRLQTCGEFCVPGSLNISNITDTETSLGWLPGSTQTQWEYVVQIENSGIPTGNGTLASSNQVNVSNLIDGYTYEVYYRSVCSTGFSAWEGPKTFTTLISYDRIIDCSSGNYTLNYCYQAVDWDETPQEFKYTSSDGNPLLMVINEGIVGYSSFSGDDELVVKDGNGNLLYRGIGNNGDLSGLIFRSNTISPTNNVLQFYIDATSLGGCYEDGLKPIKATVSCLSCQNIPEATFTKILDEDCNNNPQYILEVDVTSFGDATSLVLSDNLGLYSETVNELGIVNIGPFNFGVDVQLTLADESSSSCLTKSKVFNVNNCPPSNDDFENATEITIGATDYCNNGIKGTLVEATPSPNNIPAISCSSTSGNDVWYKFVATQTVHRIIFRDFLSNEHLNHSLYKGEDSTNLTELYCYENWYGFAANPIILTPLLTIGDTYYIRAYTQSHHVQEFDFTICVQDPPASALDVICNDAEPICLDETGTFKTTNTTGLSNYLQAGCLEWTANPTWMTFEVQESGPLNFTMSQIGGNASNDMDIAIFGPFTSLDAMCSDYLTMKPVACKATNSGIEKLKIKNVNADEKYLILSMNQSNYSHDLTVQQSNFNEEGAAVLKNRFKEPIAPTPEPICDDLGDGVEVFDLTVFDTEILNGDTSFTVSYYLSRTDAQNDNNPISFVEVTAGNTQAVFARIHTGIDSGCYSIIHFALTVIANPEANSIYPGLICDELSDGYENVDLSSFSNGISGDATSVTVQYYLSESQANLGSSPLYPVLKIESGTSVEVYVRVTDENYCFSTTSFVLTVDHPYAEFNTNEVEYSVCSSGNVSTSISLINDNFDQFNEGVAISWYRNNELLPGQSGMTLFVYNPGTYKANMTVNNTDCTFSAEAIVIEKRCFESVKYAEGISANNDGINDSFDLRNAKVNKIKIYDRNGMLVYMKINYTNEWHGQNNNGNQLPVGVYFYTVALMNGETINGSIYLNR